MKNVLSLRQPKPNTSFCRYNDRLALFHQTTDALEYWKYHWSDSYRRQLIAKGRSGDLSEFSKVIHYVPKDLPVLEAGCGPARLVAALHTRGYDVIGIDYEQEVVRYVNEVFPELDVRVGNVKALEFPSESFGAYVSLGIVEHFEEGPAEALAEARRVLRKEGVAVFEIPYLNPARHVLLQGLSPNDKEHSDLVFHQYYFGLNDFEELLQQAGFAVVERIPDCFDAFLMREHPLFSRFWNSTFCPDRAKPMIRRTLGTVPTSLQFRYAHMMIFVCKPV
jgi:SAM-dependent methyltransferase